MKHFYTVAAVVSTMSIGALYIALQPPSPPPEISPSPTAVSAAAREFMMDRTEVNPRAQELWESYRVRLSGTGVAANEALGQLTNIGFPPTRENTQAVISQLKSPSTPIQEKQDLTTLLGRMYWHARDPEAKTMTEEYLRSVAMNTTDPNLGRTTAQVYSRTSYFPDSVAVLIRAKTMGWIGEDDFYGDIAHLFPGAPPEDQPTLLRTIDSGNNLYAKRILADLMSDPVLVQTLQPPVAEEMILVLSREEPKFSEQPDSLGAGSVIQYEKWISAIVALHARSGGESERAALARLIRPEDDPRKLLAVLSEEHTANLVRATFDSETLAKINTNVSAYAKQNSSNPTIQEYARIATRNLTRKG